MTVVYTGSGMQLGMTCIMALTLGLFNERFVQLRPKSAVSTVDTLWRVHMSPCRGHQHARLQQFLEPQREQDLLKRYSKFHGMLDLSKYLVKTAPFGPFILI